VGTALRDFAHPTRAHLMISYSLATAREIAL
jgi:hypothetical protein